jgi:hypothetical protein
MVWMPWVWFRLHTGIFLATHGYGLDLTGMHYAPNLLPPLAHWVPFTLFKNNYKDVLSFPQIRAQCTLSPSLGILFEHLKDLPQFVSVIKERPCYPMLNRLSQPSIPTNAAKWMDGWNCMFNPTYLHPCKAMKNSPSPTLGRDTNTAKCIWNHMFNPSTHIHHARPWKTQLPQQPLLPINTPWWME